MTGEGQMRGKKAIKQTHPSVEQERPALLTGNRGAACRLLEPRMQPMDNDWIQAPSTAEIGHLGSDHKDKEKNPIQVS